MNAANSSRTMRGLRYGACLIVEQEVRLKSIKEFNNLKLTPLITKSYLQIINKYFSLFNNIDKVHVIRSHAREERLIK